MQFRSTPRTTNPAVAAAAAAAAAEAASETAAAVGAVSLTTGRRRRMTFRHNERCARRDSQPQQQSVSLKTNNAAHIRHISSMAIRRELFEQRVQHGYRNWNPACLEPKRGGETGYFRHSTLSYARANAGFTPRTTAIRCGVGIANAGRADDLSRENERTSLLVDRRLLRC